MKSHLFLQRTYDIDRLRRDLKSAEQHGVSHLHFSPQYHDGGWSAIPLVSLGGQMDADALRHGHGTYQKTPVLAHCRYFEEIIDSFHCPTQRVRLMRLEPGTNILEHCDPGDSWALGQVRLHIPIVTHEDVYFYVDKQRVVMGPGELWFCDFCRPHSVANRSPIARVHLVLDLTVNKWLAQMFPRESWAEQLNNWVYWWRFHADEILRWLARSTGVARVKRKLRLLWAGGQSSNH